MRLRFGVRIKANKVNPSVLEIQTPHDELAQDQHVAHAVEGGDHLRSGQLVTSESGNDVRSAVAHSSGGPQPVDTHSRLLIFLDQSTVCDGPLVFVLVVYQVGLNALSLGYGRLY